MAVVLPKGTNTQYLPAKDKSQVILGPLLPIGSLKI